MKFSIVVAVHDLTARQQQLLSQLVQYYEEQRLFGAIRPIPTGPAAYTIYLRGKHNMTLHHIGDLDALCAAGYLDYEYTRFGNNKVFTLSQRALVQNGAAVNPNRYFAKRMKQQLIILLADDTLTDALTEVEFVRHETESNHPNAAALSHSLEKLNHLIAHQLRHDGYGSRVACALVTLAQWIDHIALTVEL